MKAIMVMFDSLNRHMLPPYGCDWVHAPNFSRLARHAVTFDNAYAGSMPCMPARRELHTGRYNFLHCGWGPMEPFDDSTVHILKQAGVWTHLISDHYHYWEEGGANYHTKFNTWEIIRGQEGDPWADGVNRPPFPNPNFHRSSLWDDQNWLNRARRCDDGDMPQAQTFRAGIDFIRRNARNDNWFLQLETFDPHEPYDVPERFQQLYDWDFSSVTNDWPLYGRAGDPALTERYRMLNAALISMCDESLGLVLDEMDRLNLWDDTLLIVNTDHGFLLGEHDFWAKCAMPFYNEIVHLPLFIWDPRSRKADVRRRSLIQTIDLPATLLNYFGQELPPDMQGVPLVGVIASDEPVREAALFGLFGAQVNCTDGRYVYMRGPACRENLPLNHYTLMPSHAGWAFSPSELHGIDGLQLPFRFTKGCKTLRIAGRPAGVQARGGMAEECFHSLLFDLHTDPGQQNPLDNPELEERMQKLMTELMRENDAPPEQFIRLGFA